MSKKRLDDEGSDNFIPEVCVKPQFAIDEDGIEYQVSSAIGRDGKEYPDPVPMEPPIGYEAPMPLMEMIRRMVHSEQGKLAADAAGWDTIDEAGDFDVMDDADFMDVETAYEVLGSVAQAGVTPPPVASEAPPSPAAVPQVTAAKEGGGGGPSQETAPAPPLPSSNST